MAHLLLFNKLQQQEEIEREQKNIRKKSSESSIESKLSLKDTN